ncbi:MAG: type IV pilus assembly protein PilM [Gammaproteobacteria bacterium]|nr:type IV pilus assembly protein PilM [Gammaproteobacteria bacterium]
MGRLSEIFKRKAPAILGLDISTTAVKLLELSRNGEQYRVESYAVEPLPPNSIVEKTIADVEGVGDAIKRAVKRSGTKAKLAAAAVAGSAVITKVITLPASISDDEMEGQIELEADQYIPFPLDEVNLDFEVIGRSMDDPEKIEVLLAASRSENVELRVDAIEIGGLTAKIIDIEANAIETAFSLIREQMPDYGLDKTIAIVDIGATMTTLSVLHDLKTVYTREQTFGGKQLTEDIQRRYGLSYEEAGMAKRQGGLPDDYHTEVLEPFKRMMVQQVGRALQFFYSSSQYSTVDHIVLAGGSSSVEGIAELIAEQEGVATTIANPFANMSISSSIKAQVLENDAPALMISCGLALRSWD